MNRLPPLHSPPPPKSVVDEAMALLQLSLRAVVDRVRLLGFELRTVATRLAAVAVLAGVALLLAGTAWTALWFGIAVVLHEAGVTWATVATAICAVNLIGISVSIWGMRRCVRQLSVSATLRHLTVADSQPDADEDVDLHSSAAAAAVRRTGS